MIMLLLTAALAAPLVDAVDVELQAAGGAGATGLWVRGRHTWHGPGPDLVAGAALAGFTGSESWDAGGAQTDGRVSDLHLDATVGPVFHPGSRDRLGLELSAYAGVYGYRSRGTWNHAATGVEETVVVNAVLPDAGFRLATGWRVAPAWDVQLSVTRSTRRVWGAQGVVGGLFSVEPDAKLSAGLGVSWRRGA